MAPPPTLQTLPAISERERPMPLLRGWLHVVTFLASLPAGALLIALSDGALARTAVAIYSTTLLLSFGTSAAYHRLARSPSARRVMQRLDHAMIYLLIAGTYVPASLLGLPLRWGIPLLSFVGAGALAGVVLKLAAFHRGPAWLAYSLYPLIGWAALAVLPVLISHVDVSTWLLILGGGLAYTVGFPVLLLRRPDPWPRVFGYHEVWHTFTVVAAVLHFAAVVSLAG